MLRRRLIVKGVVQGVGFRPFVYRLAQDLNLKGFVRNTTHGVEIEVEGGDRFLERFISRLKKEKPKAAQIDNISVKALSLKKEKQFVIKESKFSKGFTQLSPDIATCKDCLEEFNTKEDRRYKFPFINCTNCGPRYSIIVNTPYDRKRTSMKDFKMCPQCAKEFKDITDRRFHAQPNCCRICGPEFFLYSITGKKLATQDPIEDTAQLLIKGEIVAIKAIGGFHIACDATNCRSVARLRRLKNRPTKPFAIMAKYEDLDKIVDISKVERKIINSPVAPIMLLRKKGSIVCEEVAPQNPYLGVMVPYVPVHHLLLKKVPYLVLTSANIQDEPIAIDDFGVKTRLNRLVSFYLTHSRKIINRCDDSLGFYVPAAGFSIIRRSRGYVPAPIELPFPVRPTLALGPHLKNTFTLAARKEAYVSPHIGELDNLATLNFFNEMVAKYQRWFKIEPELILHDLHPDYLSTRIAKESAKASGCKLKGVQHHIAHIVACLGEHKIFDRVIGIAFDGTGFGTDGKIWGSEFFVGDIKNLARAAHLEYLPLPGGEESIKKPYRIAIAYLYKLLGSHYLKDKKVVAPFIRQSSEIETVIKMLEQNCNLGLSSSMGRLFDAVSALVGITEEITYEAEAAINLEYVAAKEVNDSYQYKIVGPGFGSVRKDEPGELIIYLRDIFEGIINDIKKGIGVNIISAKFHNTVVQFSLDIAKKLRKIHNVNIVVLSGGVFQNRYLLNLMIKRLKETNFKVYIHHKLPTNDGCISYGQVIKGNLI